MIDRDPDREMAERFALIIRRVKHSMSYRGSYSTEDILGSLVARWLESGEWDRLRGLAPGDRRIGESVRRFLLDRIGHVRRRGSRATLGVDDLLLPDDQALSELVDAATLRAWIRARIAELEAGRVDVRMRLPVFQPAQIGRAMRMHLEGRTQRQIATALGVAVSVANKRVSDGISYLIVLHGIEQGIAPP